MQDGYEEDTIQSYFSVDKIYEFVGDKAEILYFHITVDQDSSGEIYGKRAHIVLRKKIDNMRRNTFGKEKYIKKNK